MRFANWNRLVDAFGEADTAVTSMENGEAGAVVVTVGGTPIRISVGLGDQVGRQLFKGFRAERRLPPKDWDMAAVNGMNNASAAITLSRPDEVSIVFPVAANELGSERDAPAFTMNALNLQRPCLTSSDKNALRMATEFSAHVGLAEDAEAYVRSIPSNDDVIFASRDMAAQRFFFNILIGDGFLEDAAVRDYCGHLVSADFYDPHYRSTAMNDVERAQAHGRTAAYKLFYANQWNCEHGLKYWRLRATVLGDRLVFRMPFLAPLSGSLDFTREFDAINLVISHRFHYRGRTWQPIDTGNPLTMLGKRFAMDLLQKAFFPS